jgi:hypothetical protein
VRAVQQGGGVTAPSLSLAQAHLADLCDALHTTVDPSIGDALERARVVGLLDAWAEARWSFGASWTTARRDVAPDDHTAYQYSCRNETFSDGKRHINREFYGETPDAARAAAAKAIESADL